ncbi:nucleotidyltransferase family protein [Rhodanobacter sp. UC4451_H18]
MLPPLKVVRAGLRRTTEALAAELARPGGATPPWSDLEWQLAAAAAAVHGVSPLLCRLSAWRHPPWQAFLAEQHAHVEHRHRRIETLLQGIDAGARASGVAVIALKGCALHALGVYAPGERPMADIDLLVREDDVAPAIGLLQELGYVESFVAWKHRVFKPATGAPFAGLGEHRDTPVNIELHTCIQERLPVTAVDITARIRPPQPRPGLNPYPSAGALMNHLLLHAAGNLCNRSLRLLHLHDIALLSARLAARDWNVLWDERAESPWYALPPLLLVERYYRGVIPPDVLARLGADCHPLLRMVSHRQTLTRVSSSDLWLHALHGIEWSRSAGELGRYLGQRIRPTQESNRERADMVRTQLWLQQGPAWAGLSQRRRILTWLTRPVPRMDTMFAVRAALESPARAP